MSWLHKDDDEDDDEDVVDTSELETSPTILFEFVSLDEEIIMSDSDEVDDDLDSEVVGDRDESADDFELNSKLFSISLINCCLWLVDEDDDSNNEHESFNEPDNDLNCDRFFSLCNSLKT